MVTIRGGLTCLACLLFLAACQEDGPQASESQTAFPDLLEMQRSACERDRGRWALAPSKAAFVCYRNLRDANQSCRIDSDCQGLCLARSRTCSPIEPFYGCHEVLTNDGVQQTLCLD
jgi:hypothetical protein